MISFTPEQEAIIQSLKDFKPQLTPNGCYAVMTTSELHHMRSEEFIQLCEELVPAHHDLIVAYAMRKGSYLGDAIRKTLVKYIQQTYVTVAVAELKLKYPSFFKRSAGDY